MRFNVLSECPSNGHMSCCQEEKPAGIVDKPGRERYWHSWATRGLQVYHYRPVGFENVFWFVSWLRAKTKESPKRDRRSIGSRGCWSAWPRQTNKVAVNYVPLEGPGPAVPVGTEAAPSDSRPPCSHVFLIGSDTFLSSGLGPCN